MIYIIEGVDGVGKTSVVDSLKTLLPKRFKFVKESATDSAFEKWDRVKRVEDFLKRGCDVVYDRSSLIDEFVYEPIIAHKEPVFSSSEAVARIETILSLCTVIYLHCDKDVIIERTKERGDDYIDLNKDLDVIAAQYENVFSELGIKPRRICTEKLDSFEVAGWIRSIILQKQPKVAEIVPLSCLPLTVDNQYHMCLAHLVQQSDAYTAFYRKMSDMGKFVLMDNGAAEDAQLDFDQLIAMYRKINPTEIVLPDVLRDRKATIEKSSAFIKELNNRGELPKYTFMFVPQGRTFDEWRLCMDYMLDLHRGMISSIGVSKFLDMLSTTEVNVREKAVAYIEEKKIRDNIPGLEIHLLGCSEGAATIRSIFSKHPSVRGVDSAIGYLYAQNKQLPSFECGRPEGEIDFLEGKEPEALSSYLKIFEQLTGVHYNGIDPSWQFTNVYRRA